MLPDRVSRLVFSASIPIHLYMLLLVDLCLLLYFPAFVRKIGDRLIYFVSKSGSSPFDSISSH